VSHLNPTKKDDPRCSCVPGMYQCGWCSAIERQRIWRRMSPEDRAYDRYVDPANSAVLDSERGLDLDRIVQGCSCHINPPCSYCTRETDDQEPSDAQ
jgi:hypothetical protein